MSAIYGFASRLSGCMAGLCAILALLALPSPSRADTLSDCQACCREKGFVDQELSACVGNCMQGSGSCAAAPSCSKRTGDCDLFGESKALCEPAIKRKCNQTAEYKNCDCRFRFNLGQDKCLCVIISLP